MPKKLSRPPRPRLPRDPLEEAANAFSERLADVVDIFFDRVVSNLLPGQVPPLPRPTRPAPGTSSQNPPPRAQPLRTLYDDLEVSPHASQETITVAYRSLSKRYHPDVNKSSSAAERIRQINRAYSVLKEPKTRKEYDFKMRGFVL